MKYLSKGTNQMSINDTHVHIAELGIWISKTADGILCMYDKKMITRKRNQMIKSNPADVAKIDAAIAAAKIAAVAGTKIDAAAAKTAAESVVYMMTESGEMVPIATK
jgi:hypothetical protein